jgi:hypothetical protein
LGLSLKFFLSFTKSANIKIAITQEEPSTQNSHIIPMIISPPKAGPAANPRLTAGH